MVIKMICNLKKINWESVLFVIAILFSVVTGFIGGVPSPLVLLGFVVIVGFWLCYKKSIKSIGLIKTKWFNNALIGAVSGISLGAIALIVFIKFPQSSAHFFQLPIIFSEKTGIESHKIIKFIFPISYIIGSLIHELFYRGFLQSRLSAHIKPVYSILLTAGLFGWGHFPEGIYSILIGFYEGIMCGVLFHKAGSIVSPWSFRIFHIGTILIILGVL